MTARTPGPSWWIDADGALTQGMTVMATFDCEVSHDERLMIAEACSAYDRLTAENAALREALTTMVEQFDHYTHYEADQNEVAAIDKARAALAKRSA